MDQNGGWLWPKDVHPGNEKECVSLVRALIPGLSHSGAWKEGDKITPELIETLPRGTAIATFRNGHYNNGKHDHTSIFDGPDTDRKGNPGIAVYDQWNGARGGGGRRVYPFTDDGTTHFLAGQFSTIAKP